MTKFTIFRQDKNTQEFIKGSVIFEEGTPGDVMYAVIKGDVELRLQGVPVNQVGADEIFGEMALVDDSPRSATAHATTDCKLAVVDQKRFESLVQQTPNFAVQVMRVMADRLRKTTEISIKEKIKKINPSVLDALFAIDD